MDAVKAFIRERRPAHSTEPTGILSLEPATLHAS
jgi:hypothetical protein